MVIAKKSTISICNDAIKLLLFFRLYLRFPSLYLLHVHLYLTHFIHDCLWQPSSSELEKRRPSDNGMMKIWSPSNIHLHLRINRQCFCTTLPSGYSEHNYLRGIFSFAPWYWDMGEKSGNFFNRIIVYFWLAERQSVCPRITTTTTIGRRTNSASRLFPRAIKNDADSSF